MDEHLLRLLRRIADGDWRPEAPQDDLRALEALGLVRRLEMRQARDPGTGEPYGARYETTSTGRAALDHARPEQPGPGVRPERRERY